MPPASDQHSGTFGPTSIVRSRRFIGPPVSALMLVVVAALALSGRVTGSSMEPSLHTGDRVVAVPVVGDNWGGSDDSRTYGFVAAEQIRGRLWLRLLPLSDLGRLEHGVRLEPVG